MKTEEADRFCRRRDFKCQTRAVAEFVSTNLGCLMLHSDKRSAVLNSLTELLATRSATVGVIGLGYVGLPLAVAVAR